MKMATAAASIGRAAPADVPAIATLLREAGLPHEDFAAYIPRFLVARRDGGIIGAIGAEVHAPDALLRSLVVAPAERGGGLGGRLCEALESAAESWGVRRWWLLTTTAERFFATRGFRKVARTAAPPAIAATAEFRGLCPSVAVCLSRHAAWTRRGATALTIGPMTEADWPAVAAIYREGIATGHATFAPAPPESYSNFCDGAISAGSLVARRADGAMAGWTRITRVSSRAVYAGVAEVSVYVAAQARSQGIGDALMREMIARAEAAGVWTLQASIFEENTASLALHARHGFRVAGRRERIGRMPAIGPCGGQWRDTLLLERRSGVAGT